MPLKEVKNAVRSDVCGVHRNIPNPGSCLQTLKVLWRKGEASWKIGNYNKLLMILLVNLKQSKILLLEDNGYEFLPNYKAAQDKSTC